MGCGSTKLFPRDQDGIGWPSIPVRSIKVLPTPDRPRAMAVLLQATQ